MKKIDENNDLSLTLFTAGGFVLFLMVLIIVLSIFAGCFYIVYHFLIW